jgi:pimeloyl-ACP methyl ester carboxylesterase
VQGKRHSIIGGDGVNIGLLTAGSGPPLLLIHGGMGRLERWEPLWGALGQQWQVTAMDRRGRGSSGDSQPYALTKEFDDVAAVASSLADQHGPIDVFGHSFGATCALGAAAAGAPFRRVALYEPPGPQAVTEDWIERITSLITVGKVGRVVFSFLTEIIGLSAEQFEGLRAAPGAQDVLPIAAATLPREAQALIDVDLIGVAADVVVPVLLLLGAESPAWAGEITHSLAATLPNVQLHVLAHHGHEAIDSAPNLIASELLGFFGDSP